MQNSAALAVSETDTSDVIAWELLGKVEEAINIQEDWFPSSRSSWIFVVFDILGRAHTESTRHESTRSPPPLYPI